MSVIQFNTPDWSIQSKIVSRGSRSAAGVAPPDFPPDFLTEESEVTEQFIAEPRTETRGQLGTPGALDFSCDLGDGETAILSIRHPSGALTFHLPVESASRGLRQPNQVRFVVTVRSTDVATGKRGIVSKVIKATLIKVGKVVADKAVSFVLPKLAAAFEKNAWNKDGLEEGWLKVTRETLARAALAPGKPTSPDRSLLFIHGTFSNAASAYSSLAGSSFFERVKDMYGDRMFAFDHFTVSRTPEENARMLLEGLPDQTTTFDVITHSRGGLVLRNLVERAGVFGPLARRFKLGRAVLVASPNDGTPLATPQRWGDTVGWIANLLELFPDNPFTTGAAFVANGLVWLARHASGDLPGLHSMDGNGRQIASLQSPPGPPSEPYSALVANYNPTGAVLLRMLDTGIDQFFGTANDLVVPTQGGWRVPQPGTVFIPAARIGCYGPGGNLSADSVTHVNFFSRPETVDFLTRALSGEQQILKPINPLATLPDRRLLREGTAVFAASAAGTPSAEPSRVKGRGKAIPPSVVPPKPPAQPPLRITVVNGDLTFEQEPLLLGHYRASRLTGTERVVDDLIGNAMQHSLDLGLYPLAPGSHQLFLNTRPNPESPKRMPRPKAVVVVGLGAEGKLSAADLSHTVRQAVIAWAQRTTELDKKAPQFFDLCATLLGSGGSGITAGQAAQRIAEGVYVANQLLRGELSEGQNWPRVRHLKIVELYLDRATEAWRALKLQASATPDRYEIADEINAGTGPLPRPLDSGYRGADYDFISAEVARGENGQTLIQYTLDTKRARSEVRAQQTQVQLVRDLVATASTDPHSDKQIGRTLFKLLVPVEMEAFLAGTGEMQFELEPETAGIPWELLDDDGDEDPNRRPWAIRAKLLRKLRTKEFRQQVADADADSNILVIGEPECPANYPRLSGAWKEAAAVYQCLTSPGALDPTRVRRLLSDDPDKKGPDARAVINASLERDWRIVHIAGHGELPAKDGGPGGVVLSNGTFLGASEIATMRSVPELVFVNCCHLAARNVDQLLAGGNPPGYNRVRFASGVAEQLIKIGVKCVIAAGWAVDDSAAATFATKFYSSLLQGNRFIDAVAEAREAAYNKEENTWAAYQCYGDPDWVFRNDGPEAGSPTTAAEDKFAGVASEAALKLALETIFVQTTFQGFKPEAQLERVRLLEKRFAPKWGSSGSVAELFGRAYVAGRDISSAIPWYERAVAASDGAGSMKAVEQLANVYVRLAWETVAKAQKNRDSAVVRVKDATGPRSAPDRKALAAAKRSLATAEHALQASLRSARSSIKDAMTLLEKLLVLQSTIERESIYGSACKRLALVEAAARRPVEERRAIEAMKLHYRRAEVIARASLASDLFYPALNYLAADLALNAGRRGWKGLDSAIVEAARASLEAKNLADPDFWSVVGQTELELYIALADGKLARTQKSLARGYQDLYRRVSAPWLWSSVFDTTRFVLQKYAVRASVKENNAADTLLACLGMFTQRN
jgi:CHAT domain-containing protein